MMEFYRGQRITELLEIIEEMEQRLKRITTNDADSDHQPFSMAQYEEVAQGYATLALAKARLKALQGEPM